MDEEVWFGQKDSAVAEDAAARSMAALVGRIIGAKPFPESARKLESLTRNEVVRIEPVIQVLERDPALSARLLRLVNSAGYALRQRCTSVRHAATLVGTDRLHQIATTAAVLDMFDAKGPIAAKVIEHSTVVGAFCRYLGAHLALPVDDLFTAGFLHDIGKMMLLETEGEQYVEMLESSWGRPDTLHLLERAAYGFDHADLGSHVLTAWNIPDPVPKIVAWHHEPTRAYQASSMMAALVQTVRLADALVYAFAASATRDQIGSLAQLESASYLDISEPQLASMWDELYILYTESIEQCRGENAPALDPRSLRPKRPLSASMDAPPASQRSLELPKSFPCVVCERPTFGNTCAACHGHVCPEHQLGDEEWCRLCVRDFQQESPSLVPAVPPIALSVTILVTLTLSVLLGGLRAGFTGAVEAGVGASLLIVLVGTVGFIAKRWLTRLRFLRMRPDRSRLEPISSDGGTQSLVPPPVYTEAERADLEAISESLRVATPMRDVTIRELSSSLDDEPPHSASPFDLSDSSYAQPSGDYRVMVSSEDNYPIARPHVDRDAMTIPVPDDASVLRALAARARVTAQTEPAPGRLPESGPDQGAPRGNVSRDTLMGVQPEPPPASTDDDGPIQPMRVLEPAASQDDPEPSTEAPRATVDTEPPPPPVAMPSEHPLAALGLSSRPPAPPAASTPTADIMDSSSDDAPSGVVETTGRIAPAPPLQSAPESSLAPPAIEREENEDRSNQTSSDLAPESAPVAATDATHPESEPPMESLAPSAPASTIDQLAQSLMADLAGRLAPSLEKRIFELVAERVAERLAEQVLANMGAGGKHTAPARRPSPQADAPASDSAQDEAQPVKRSTRPRKKASSAS